MPKQITLYTDGGCRGNPGIGGWGCILSYQHHRKEFSGNEQDTTNNRMELTAVIRGLEQLKEPCEVRIFSDSKYVCEGIDKWLSNWIKKNWKTANNKAVLNQDLWQHLATLLDTHHSVHCEWIKGHSGHPENEHADALSNQAMDALQS